MSSVKIEINLRNKNTRIGKEIIMEGDLTLLNISTDCMRLVIAYLNNIEKLDLRSTCKYFDKIISPSGINARHLDPFKDKVDFIRECVKITRLAVDQCDITDLANFCNLHKTEKLYVELIENKMKEKTNTSIVTVKHLDIMCFFSTKVGSRITELFPNLTSISVQCTGSDDSELEDITGFERIEIGDLECETGFLEPWICRMKNVRVLKLETRFKYTSEIFKGLKYTNLRELYVVLKNHDLLNFTENAIEIGSVSNLEILHINIEDTKTLDKLTIRLEKSLKHLSIRGGNITLTTKVHQNVIQINNTSKYSNNSLLCRNVLHLIMEGESILTRESEIREVIQKLTLIPNRRPKTMRKENNKMDSTISRSLTLEKLALHSSDITVIIPYGFGTEKLYKSLFEIQVFDSNGINYNMCLPDGSMHYISHKGDATESSKKKQKKISNYLN